MWICTTTTAVKGRLGNLRRYFTSADNEILQRNHTTGEGSPLTMLLFFSKYPWSSPVLTESSYKSTSPLKPNSNNTCQSLPSPRNACATGKFTSWGWTFDQGEIRIPFPLPQDNATDLRCILPHRCGKELHTAAVNSTTPSHWLPSLPCFLLLPLPSAP